MQASSSIGKVFLVGAGPGDPELITLKALRCLRQADVVVYDRLICPDLLDEVPPHALRVFVGKESRHHTMPQREINALLVVYAKQGLRVVRLKGGDPFVFGRGGEEAQALVDAGIPFEIVPGISSAIAVPAYAGIPVTHRGLSSSVMIVTGHEERGNSTNSTSTVNWEAASMLVTSGGTLVILMGVETLSKTTQRLLESGLSPDMPVAVIQQGTIPQQRAVTDSLTHIVERVQQANLKSPAVIVVGAVAELSNSLAWYEAAYPAIYKYMV
ncbi:MAG TPA: uroporphyrinogen-III C-methyltransferase [Ktedonobacter sp.]|nr:uroporphyrinogen-III C-methyltransferase [Ktedonobacter sp.]